jgi:hypothetical protein
MARPVPACRHEHGARAVGAVCRDGLAGWAERRDARCCARPDRWVDVGWSERGRYGAACDSRYDASRVRLRAAASLCAPPWPACSG